MYRSFSFFFLQGRRCVFIKKKPTRVWSFISTKWVAAVLTIFKNSQSARGSRNTANQCARLDAFLIVEAKPCLPAASAVTSYPSS